MTSLNIISNYSNILAQAGQPQPGLLETFFPMILLMVGFWFLIIGPQRKKQKQHQKMLTELQSGDEIVTSGGIYGTITNVKDDRFVVKIADSTKIEITKGSIASRASEAAAEVAKK